MRFKVIIFFIIVCFSTESFAESPGGTAADLSPVRVKDQRLADSKHNIIETVQDKDIIPNTLLKTEVAGFSLTGKKPWERLIVNDLDIVIMPSGQRFMPLLRLLKLLQVSVEIKEDVLSCNPTHYSKIFLNISAKEIQINDKRMPVQLVAGQSDITLEKDIYLAPEVVSEILLMKIEWDEDNYGYIAKTDQKLSIWKLPQGKSLFSLKIKEVPTNLPELFPPAHPVNFSLDFIELQLRPYFATEGQGSASRWAIDSPKQSFFGGAFGGRYSLQFSEPWMSWGDSGYQKGYGSVVMLNRGDWTYVYPDAEITAGDSRFGLNSLTFPIVKMTGIRFNGLVGFPEEKDCWRRSPGIGDYFVSPHVFEGEAPVGSTVELYVNDRRIETQDVVVGTYRFEDIRLAPGTLNLVRIIITEASGYQRMIEKSIFGRSINLPKGGLTYLGGVGTNRQVYDWTTRGFFGGGRVLYGVTDSLTLGTTWAAQENFYRPLDDLSVSLGARQYPRSSLHMGGQAAWVPFERLFLYGDTSFSRGNGEQKSYSDVAYNIQGNLYPSRNIQLHSQFFHYGPDFFNGENAALRDREGYAVDGRWSVNSKWWINSTVGGIWNNLDDQAENTLHVDFQNLEISSKILPRMTIAAGVNRVSPSWEDGPKVLYKIKMLANPFKDVHFEGTLVKGDYLDPAREQDFFSGLRIKGFSTYRPPTATANLRMPVGRSNSLSFNYWEDQNRKRTSVLHNFSSQGKPLRVHTEIGYDAGYEEPFFENRVDYRFGISGQRMIGFQTRYEYGDWTASLILSINELFSHSRGSFKRIADGSIRPERGGVHGRVFVDTDANGIIGPDKPGVGNIRVVVDNGNSVLTDQYGYFILSCANYSRNSRVFLDMDSIPAIYTPTHAIQTANLNPGSLVEINFGITPLISITGFVLEAGANQSTRPLSGIRVYLTSTTDDQMISDSITAGDGSYYLENIRPGRYYLRVDTKTIPDKYGIQDAKRIMEIMPKKEPQELKPPPFLATVLSTKT